MWNKMGKTSNSQFLPGQGKSWNIHPTFQLFRGVPKGLAFISPVLECWLDRVYSGCLEASENKTEQDTLWLLQKTPGAAPRNPWNIRQRMIQIETSGLSLRLKKKKKAWRLHPVFWVFRRLHDRQVSFSPVRTLMGPGIIMNHGGHWEKRELGKKESSRENVIPQTDTTENKKLWAPQKRNWQISLRMNIHKSRENISTEKVCWSPKSLSRLNGEGLSL